MSINELKPMIGKTMTSVENRGEQMVFTDGDGTKYVFYHSQSCCETVTIEDVCGDLDDLIGSPILVAEEVDNADAPAPDTYESYTWTFYRFATAKGTVTVRWLGTSNGYYSESVDFQVEKRK